jgi:selenocysteine-specific elongation factor
MVAGVASRQVALLTVAANDSVMPQTREHVGILHLLGLRRGIIAVTKTDMVGAEQLDEARRAIDALVAGTFLDSAPILAVSALTDLGMPELRAALADAARLDSAVSDEQCFRLAVDRAFNVKGTGLVATGTVHSGSARVGDELVLAPQGLRVRIRGLRVQDRDAESAVPGDRCALNVTSIERDQVTRGSWLVAPDAFFPTTRFVMDLEVLADYPRAIKHWTPVQVHHAADHCAGRLALLDSPPVAPGTRACVELELDRPMHPKRGDRIVLRDDARECTLGGGEVIEISPPLMGRRRAARLQRIAMSAAVSPREAMTLLLDTDDGLAHEPFRQNWNLATATFAALLAPLGVRTVDLDGGTVSFAAARIDTLEAQVRERLGAYHKAAPYSPGLRRDRLQQVITAPQRMLDIALFSLQRSGEIARSNGHFHLAGHRPRLAPDDEASLRQLTELLSGAHPPSIGDMAKALKRDLKTLHVFIDRLSALGLLVRVSESRCLLPTTIDRLVQVAIQLTERPDGFTAAEFRDITGIGRNVVIDVLEYFDRRGVTRRSGDRRRVVSVDRI